MASKYLREVARREADARARDALKVVRQHFTGFEARDGFHAAKLTATQRRRILKKFETVRLALEEPHAIVKPANRKQTRALRLLSRQRMRGMKHFIVPVPPNSTVQMVGDTPQVVTKIGGRKVRQRHFVLPRRPKSPDDVIKMLEKMHPDMPEGFYLVTVEGRGAIGEPLQYENLIRQMRDFIREYNATQDKSNRKYSDVVTGWLWISTTSKAGDKVVAVRDKRREAVRKSHELRKRELLLQSRKDAGGGKKKG